MAPGYPRCAWAQSAEVTGQTGIAEIQLGRFDQALVDVGEPGRQQKDDVALPAWTARPVRYGYSQARSSGASRST